MSNVIFKSSVWVLILSNFGNIFMYLFQVVLARKLEVSEYGLFNSLNSIGVLFTSIFGVLPYFISKVIIQGGLKYEFHSSLMLKLFQFGFIILIIFVVFILCFSSGETLFTYLALMSSVFSYYFLVLVLGFFQSRFFHISHSFFQLMNSSLKLLVVLSLALFISFDHNVALFSIGIANLLTIVPMLFYLARKDFFSKKLVSENIISKKIRGVFKSIFPTLFTLLFVGIYSNVDIFLVSIFSDTKDTGNYSVLSILGRIAFFLPSVLIPILFPEVLNPKASKDKRKSIFLSFMGITLFIGLMYGLIMFFYSDFVVLFLFGDNYISDKGIIFYICLAMVFVSILNVVFNFSLAVNVISFIYVNFFTIMISIVVFYISHPSGVYATVMIYFYLMFFVFTCNLLWVFSNRRKLF